MNLLRVFTLVVLGVVLGISAEAREWRGIEPLNSMRADVERILGSPWHQFSGKHSIYLVDHALVEITFADQSDPGACSGRVPLGTVLSIFVLPQGDVSLSDLEIDLKHTKTFDVPFGPLKYRAYYDQRSGFIVRTLNGKVHEICYLAGAQVRYLCPRYYRNAKHFGEMRYHDF